MNLYVVRGVPGSGKSTWAKSNLNCLILENDQFAYIDGIYCWSPENLKKSIALVRQMAEMALANGSDVCVCNTFTKKKFIAGYQELAREYGANLKVIRLVGKFDNIHSVPGYILKNMRESFEAWEGEEIVDPSK